MEFMLPAKKKSPIAEFDLNLRRSCEKGQKGIVIVFKRRGQKTIVKPPCYTIDTTKGMQL